MTEQEAVKRLEQIRQQHDGDTEALHSLADDLLIEFLRSHDYNTLADAYDDTPKWYT